MIRWLGCCLVALCACGDDLPRPGLADAGPDAADGDGGGACQPVLGEPTLELELLASGFDKPVAVSHAGDERLFVVEQHTGKIHIVAGGAVRPAPFLDIGDEISRAMEQGLLSLAFHPAYAINHRFFITYTRGDNALVLEEWRADGDPDVGDRSTRREIMVIPQGTNFHHGGRAAFGPDGYLYLGHGDGGPQFDPMGNAQNLGSLLGKFLRVDVDREDGETPYAIPPDNPFVGEDGARPEIYAYGVRNPWGWTIDPATGHLYFGDVGLALREEVSVIPRSSPGGNYGWPILMGTRCVEAGCDGSGTIPPLTEYAYASEQLCAVIGGPVYRGCRMPGHHGRLFFSDFCASFIHSLRWSELDPDQVSVLDHASVTDRLEFVSGFGLDKDGEILLVDWGEGTLHRLVPAP